MADFLLGLGQLIPFLFVLAVTYGALEVSKVFESKGVKGIISLVMGLFTISAPGLADFIYLIMPYAAAIFIIFFFLGFIKSFFKEDKQGKKMDLVLPVIIAGLILIFIASQGMDTIRRWIPSVGFLDEQNLVVLIILVVIGLVLFATYQKVTGGE